VLQALVGPTTTLAAILRPDTPQQGRQQAGQISSSTPQRFLLSRKQFVAASLASQLIERGLEMDCSKKD
jgi:hypothetical protein